MHFKKLFIFQFPLPIINLILQAQTAEVAGPADTPTEGAGLTEEVVSKLQDTATILTQERKRRGRTIPEGLTQADMIRGYNTLASHPVCKVA